METKKEIAEIVERLPADALTELLNHLRTLEEKEKRRLLIAEHLEVIINEDRGLLQRLAK